MKKDFQKWHLLKSKIEEEKIAPLFGEQEVWWCSLGANVGVEADGRNESFERPVLIFRKFNRQMFWGLPITTKKRVGKFYFTFILGGAEQTVVLSQVKTLSGKRLLRRLGKLSDNQFGLLKKAFTQLA